jgi:hypothetical protein
MREDVSRPELQIGALHVHLEVFVVRERLHNDWVLVVHTQNLFHLWEASKARRNGANATLTTSTKQEVISIASVRKLQPQSTGARECAQDCVQVSGDYSTKFVQSRVFARAKTIGTATSVERRRREPAWAISPERLARGSASPAFRTRCCHSSQIDRIIAFHPGNEQT